MQRTIRNITCVLLVSLCPLYSGCAAMAIVGGVALVAKALGDEQQKKRRAVEAEAERRRIVAAEQAERQVIVAAEQAERRKLEREANARRRIRQRKLEAERNERDRRERQRRESERVAKAEQERGREEAQEKRRAAENERRQRALLLLTSMERDVERYSTSEAKFREYLKVPIPRNFEQRYYITVGLYAWRLHLRTNDTKWEVITDQSFRRARELGRTNAWEVCSAGWTAETKTKWVMGD